MVGLLCAFAAGCRQASPGTTEAPPATAAQNLVIITIDTLRADRVGAYGYRAARTPAIDRLAREGVLFRQGFATAPITLTSHSSLMTGRRRARQPVVMANLGIVLSDGGNPAAAIQPLQAALALDADLDQARFALAVAFARTNRRRQAATTARELLQRLPADAPQRAEVARLLREVE